MLSTEDRAFFRLVSEAAFANPFGGARARLDAAIASDAGDEARSRRSAADFDRTLRTVASRLEKLGSRGREVARHTGEDRVLLEDALLFDVFHRFVDRFDRFIQEQRGEGERSLRVPFAREAMKELAQAGFSPVDSARYFALFFQLRRAFFFIDESLPGTSASMRRFRERLWQNLFTVDARLYARSLWRKMEDFSTFLVGETGTGKGTAAAAIGRAAFIPFEDPAGAFATSFEKGFVSMNLSQFPEALIESELFGHKRGAFTGAVEGHVGVFSRCSAHGAIFLDEIGEASPQVQIKLLRVLQERTFSPVGSHDVVRFSGRVVAATNRPLHELRAAGSFRDDFYYRLCSDVIEVPTLRQRLAEEPRELEELVRVILRRIVGEGSEPLVASVLAALVPRVREGYAWPGNVRELEQGARRALLNGSYEGDTTARSKSGDGESALLEMVGEETAKGLVTRYCRALYLRHGSYEEVARRTGLDRRTVKVHVTA